MTLKFKTLTAGALLTAMALAGSTASAHPSFVDGGNPNFATWQNNTPTAYKTTVNASVRGFFEDAIRMGHGCDIHETGSNVDPVVAVSWLWPTGEGGPGNWAKAPMSTLCSVDGKACTDSSTQPVVARIPDSANKANYGRYDCNNPDVVNTFPGNTTDEKLAACNAANDALAKKQASGTATITTLAAELIEGTNSTGTPSNPEVPITTLSGRLQFLGNLGYFKQNTARAPKPHYGGGFWAKGNKFTAAEIAAMGIGSAGAPYHNAVQILYAVDKSTTSIRKMAFSSASCARKLVVRIAGVDLCELHPERSAYNTNPHIGNFWFGGPTSKFKDGHGIHENFWLNTTPLIRDTAVNPYPATCTDQVNGDYDLVVMPSIAEIDSFLPFAGFATLP